MDPEKNVLLGHLRLGGSKTETQYIWPPVVIFQTKFKTYDSRWTKECESWFQERAELIKGGFVDAKTEGGWIHSFRHACRAKQITEAQWSAIEAEIIVNQGASWEGATLGSLFNLDNPANDCLNP